MTGDDSAEKLHRFFAKKKWLTASTHCTWYLPAHVNGNHWILIVIDWTEKVVKVFDSLDFQNESEIKILLMKLQAVFLMTSIGRCRVTIELQYKDRVIPTHVPFLHVGTFIN